MKIGKVLLYLAIAIIPMAIGIGVTIYIKDSSQETQLASYEEQIEVLQATIDEIGPMTDVYTVRGEVYPGKEILQDDLVPMQIPASLVTESYVLDPASVVGKQYKIGVKPGTPIFLDFTMETMIDDTTRDIDIVADAWPVGTRVGDYVDLDITYPYGETFKVLSHKRVMAINGGTLKVYLTATEQHLYNAALVDYYLQKQMGAGLNFTKYVEPGLQKEAEVYYAVPNNIEAVLLSDPNIVDQINAELTEARRKLIDGVMSSVVQEDGSAINSGRSTLNSARTQAAADYQKKLEAKAVEDAYADASGEEDTVDVDGYDPTLDTGESINLTMDTPGASNVDTGDMTAPGTPNPQDVVSNAQNAVDQMQQQLAPDAQYTDLREDEAYNTTRGEGVE